MKKKRGRYRLLWKAFLNANELIKLLQQQIKLQEIIINELKKEKSNGVRHLR